MLLASVQWFPFVIFFEFVLGCPSMVDRSAIALPFAFALGAQRLARCSVIESDWIPRELLAPLCALHFLVILLASLL